MNWKHYLRGLGLGIVLTVVLLFLTAGSRKETLTDEEIIARAKSLGMIEESVLQDSTAKARQEAKEQLRSEIEQEVSTQLEAELRAQIEAEYAAMAQQPEEEPEPEPFVFSVNKGETPYSIGERLVEIGLVASAEEFDRFLVNNGYDRKIVAAQYTIPADADMEAIARIITKYR